MMYAKYYNKCVFLQKFPRQKESLSIYQYQYQYQYY